MTEQRPITHGQLVADLKKDGSEISDDLNSNLVNKVVLLSEATALVNQADKLDTAKKQAIYNKPLGIRPLGLDLSHPSPMVKTSLTPEQADLLHMAVGIAGEAGELLHAVMSHILNREPLDMVNVIEELGDLEFFLEGFRQNQSIERETTLSQNIAKLGVRYSTGTYSDSQAQTRQDKH